MAYTSIASRTKHAFMAGLFVLATIVLPFTGVQNASAATLTWTGGGNGSSFSDGANWSTGTAPVDGDIIVFETRETGSDYQSILMTNDLTGVEFGGLTLVNSPTGNNVNYTVDTLAFTSPVLSLQGSGDKIARLTVSTSMQVTGNLTIPNEMALGLFTADVDVTGNLTAGTGYLTIGAGSSIGGNLTTSAYSNVPVATPIGGTISNGQGTSGSIRFKGPSTTIASNITANSFDSGVILNQLAFGTCSQELGGGATASGPQPVVVGCSQYGAATYTLTGTITLNSDLVIHVAQNSVVNIAGNVVTNGHQIRLQSTSLGTLNVGEQTVQAPVTETDLSGDEPSSDEVVDANEVATLTGLRRSVSVVAGGTLKGTGTVSTLYSAGTVNPGNSPGTITVLNSLFLVGGSTLEMELLNNETYDQLVVGEDYSSGGNAVQLAGTLSTILFDGWTVEQGDQFTIIDNRSETDISGAFAGLSEGTQFVVDGITFSISYVGGDGNDVVLTALNAGTDPDAPNTGIAAFVQANPAIVAAAGFIGILTLIIVSKLAARQRA